jgi:hypothetical protein
VRFQIGTFFEGHMGSRPIAACTDRNTNFGRSSLRPFYSSFSINFLKF